jgi:F-box interacting protein
MRQSLTLSTTSSRPKRNNHHKNVVSTSVRKQNSSVPLGLFALLSLDLLLEILYRLTVKSLLILKCVCKPLNSIISDPKFAKDHLRLSQTSHYHLVICPIRYLDDEFFLYDYRLASVQKQDSFDGITTTFMLETMLRFPINPEESDVLIINSCNGLICFKTSYEDSNSDLVVGNPSTGKFKILPPLENLPQGKSKTGYSIGYDGFSDTYKVVAVTCYRFHKSDLFCKTQVRIYNSNTNFWKRIADFPSKIMSKPGWYDGIFVSGTINWVIPRDQDNDSSWVILSLDLGNESYEEILQPNFGLDEPLEILNSGIFKDCLCLLAHTNTFLDIWVMKDYGNKDSWNKFFNVSFEELDYTCCVFVKLVYISEEDGQMFLEIEEELHIYNYKNRTEIEDEEIEDELQIEIPRFYDLPSSRFTSNVYAESLISP